MAPMAVVFLLALSACSAGATPVPRSSQPLWGLTIRSDASYSRAQHAELADGRVTRDEYHEAFRRFAACLGKKGFTLMDNGEQNELIQYGVPAAAGDLYDKCYDWEFEWVDTVWQLSRADTSHQAKAYAVCLTEKGITPKKTEDEKYLQLEDAHIDPADCYGRIYPHG